MSCPPRLSREAPALNAPTIPDELKAVLARALANDREERYTSATAFLADIWRLRGAQTVQAMPQGVMILDLENASPGSENEWIGPGFAESLRKSLARIQGLRIARRERIRRTRLAREASGVAVDPPGLGVALGCRWAISGSYTKAETTLRVSVSLTEVPIGLVVWSDEFTGPLDEMFAMETCVFEALMANLQLERPSSIRIAGAGWKV